MLVELAGAQAETLWVNPKQVAAVLVPSLLAPGNGMSKIILPGVVIEVKESEAQKLIAASNEGAVA